MVQLGALGGVLEHVVGIGVGDESLPRYGDGDLCHVDGDPPPPPGLGLEGHGARAAGEVQHQVSRVSGHKEAAFKDLWWSFDDVLLVRNHSAVFPYSVE